MEINSIQRTQIKKMSNITELLTIVIPCKNEGDQLIETVKALNFKGKIIISDVSNDDTIDKFIDSCKEFDFVVVRGGLPSIGRNNGAKYVKTKYVLFLDADVMVYDEKLLEDCINEMEKKDLDLLTTRFTVNDSFIYKLFYLLFDFVQFFTSLSTPFAVGGFMLFKVDKFKSLNGFNPKDKFAEDYHLSSKVEPKKFKIMNRFVVTTSRRFRKKGMFYMIKMMLKCWFNRKDDSFYTKDYGYWD